jgi:hypothetical protein
MQFAIKNNTCPSLNIGSDNKLIEEVEANKFLGLQIDNNLNWEKHIEYIIPKLSSACFAMGTVVPLMTMDTLISRRKLFRKFNILPLASEFIHCLLSFVVENLDKFKRNTDVNNLNTRRKYDLHMPNTNLTKYQKGVYYTGIK